MSKIINKKIPKKFIVILIMLFYFGQSFVSIVNGDSLSLKNIFQYDNEKLMLSFESDAYTLYAPTYSEITYLIDMEGNITHNWNSNYIQGLAVYLLQDGKLIRNCLPGVNPRFIGGGITGRIEKHDWYGDLVWEFEYFTEDNCLHHDYEVLPNGNILMIAWEYKSGEEAVAAGRDPDKLNLDQLWPDHVIEIEPIEPVGGNIVWEWHVWDHLIQDYDSSKDNYGVVGNHPELIDINYIGGVYVGRDWLHTNSIDYNEEFDQIILSAHNFNEIWVIDHSTTTEEAAGHSGGNSGKGGDILYRWGNPQAYRAGDESDKQLFDQHDATWIEPGFPGEGNILVFNNGKNRPDIDYSSVDEIVPPVDSFGNYYLEEGSAYGPDEPIWVYIAENPIDFYSPIISGAQRLPDGNTLICDGDSGFFFEVTPEKEIVWEYINPYPNQVFNHVFKVNRYQSDYKGLEILINAPLKPNKPDGPNKGRKGIEYTYISSTIDPQGDQIYYLFDWGDGTDSGLIGPINSSEEVQASHIWSKIGNYNIKVKAIDINDFESLWSDSLSVSIPRTKQSSSKDILLGWLNEYFLNSFKMFRNFLNFITLGKK
ncbi:MAG: aryl-sulfate sulfotransferase [Thermoplasmatales archaeon]|nr:MAG: aryl-sulfate sulfotransferase [Thermoplasmatales archaeon]